MLSLKLQRVGRRHQPAYRVVVAESRSKLIAPPIEDLGSYNPFSKALNVKADRIQYWMGVGAQPTVTVHNLLSKGGIIEAQPIKIAMPPKQVTEEPAEEAAPATEAASAPANEAAAAEEAAPDEAASADEPAAEEAGA